VKRVGRFFFENAFGKALGLGVLAILGNVFSGSYVFEITAADAKGKQVLNWAATPSAPSFWALIAVAVGLALYAVGVARYERRIRYTLTDAEIRRRALEVLLQPTLEAIRKDVEGGKFWSMQEIVGLLSIDRKRK
jgi:hypothetical protein